MDVGVLFTAQVAEPLTVVGHLLVAKIEYLDGHGLFLRGGGGILGRVAGSQCAERKAAHGKCQN